MKPETKRTDECSHIPTIYVIALSIILVSVFFLLKGDVGLGLSDEGHLWYGTIQTAKGAVPIRDFRSYDPGRYYWTAGWSLMIGSGIISLRIANSVFQIIGLSLGLLAVSQVITHKLTLVLSGSLLFIWMFPRHKLYESSIAMAAIFGAVLLLEKPSSKRYFATGLLVGIAGFVGRNLGAYCFVAFLGLTLFIWCRIDKHSIGKGLIWWGFGIFIGYLPILFMLILITGFADSFVSSFKLMFSPSAPILPLPIPWPWTISFNPLFTMGGLRKLIISSLFIIVPLFYIAVLIHFAPMRTRLTQHTSLLIASVFVGIPFMHHTAVRPDVVHIAQSIHAFLIGLIALPFALQTKHNKWLISISASFLLAITLSIALPTQIPPILRKMRAMTEGRSLVRYNVRGDFIWIPRRQAKYIENIRRFANKHVRSDENILIAPDMPGLYLILDKPSPIWDPFPLFPVQEERQEEIIRTLIHNNVNWVLISNRPLDGMKSRRFSNTHHLVWQYLNEEFNIVYSIDLPTDQLLMRHK